MDMENHLRCPICMEIFSSDIFQCRSGHQICKSCCDQCTSCPTCRLPYEEPKIRNRALEAILDDILLECPFRPKGCTQKLRRGLAMERHREDCKFNNFNFCKLIGFADCPFSTGPSSPALLTIQHLKIAHQVEVRKGGDLEICHENFVTKHLGRRTKKIFGRHGPDTSLWPLTLVQVDEDVYGPTLLLRCQVTGDRCSWICLFMGTSQDEAAKLQVQLSLPGRSQFFGTSGLQNEFRWKLPPIPFRQIQELLRNPPMPLPLSFLADQVLHETYGASGAKTSINIKVAISKKKPSVDPVRLKLS